MINWKNLNKLESYGRLQATVPVNLADVMAGPEGAKRVAGYSVPMAAGLVYNYAAKSVDDNILNELAALAD